MPTVSEHTAAIVALAEQADPLVTQLKSLIQQIEAEERALYAEAAANGPAVVDAIDGRRRLGSYAVSKLQRALLPAAVPAEPTVTELAQRAWAEFLPEGE